MSDLVEFLRARFDEDEARARKASGHWDDEDVRYEWEDLPDDVFAHARHLNPVRVLAEVESKRRIIDWHHRDPDLLESRHPTIGCRCYDGWPCTTLRLLALPYAKHPDYRQEWSA